VGETVLMTAFVSARTVSSCPTTSAKLRGRHFRARGTYVSLTAMTLLEENQEEEILRM